MSGSRSVLLPQSADETGEQKKSAVTPDVLAQEFLMQREKEIQINKNPDWTLLERIRLLHSKFFEELTSTRVDIEEAILSDSLRKRKSLVEQYKKLVDEYQHIFNSEQNNLDKIKHYQQEAGHITRQIQAEGKRLPGLIVNEKDELIKKLLKTKKGRTVKFNQELKRLLAEIYDIQLTPHRGLMIVDQIKQIEKDYLRLTNAVEEKDLKYFERASLKRKKLAKKTKSKVKKSARHEESTAVKELLSNLQYTFNFLRKNIDKYENTFKLKKAELSGMVIWREIDLARHEINDNLMVTPHNEIMARIAVNAEARKWISEILALQAELERDREMIKGFTKKKEDLILQQAVNEVSEKRGKYLEKIRLNPQHATALHEAFLTAVNEFVKKQPDKSAEFYDKITPLMTQAEKADINVLVDALNTLLSKENAYHQDFINLLTDNINNKSNDIPYGFIGATKTKIGYDAKKAVTFVDAECVSEILADTQSKIGRIIRLGSDMEAKALLKKLHDPISKCKKFYAHENGVVKEIRLMRRELEARFSKLKEMDKTLLKNPEINTLLSAIIEKIKALYNPKLSRVGAKKMVKETEALIGRLIKTKKKLKNFSVS